MRLQACAPAGSHRTPPVRRAVFSSNPSRELFGFLLEI
jgi:hypothetical protein